MEGPFEQVLVDLPKSPFMDPSGNFSAYDSLSGLDDLHYPGSEPFGMSALHSSPRLGFPSLNLAAPMSEYTYGSPAYTTGSPTRPFTPPQGVYPALMNLSAGEMSSDSMQSGRTSRGSGTHSPSLAAVPRSHRYNPISVPMPTRSTRERKRRATKSDDFSDDDDDFHPTVPAGTSNEVRREEIRRQRIESEQRRRDELRDGYRRLKDALPVSNQKSSKVSLLDRATTHIKYLEMTQQQLQTRLQQAEAETQRLRQVNEALMLGTAEQRHAAAAAAIAAVPQTSF
ncbi:hypothetical protein FA95DRAFT_909395 [Auriscalpium vulgare]|uniref:Uncharacterized protein n=1 Tax=Auriscalpium vulgare TaxID=40419 RepID=A0ACB8RZL2_9AGAM|nr:hypothetical protein FA95DRAFT_909395 [Auriscalpium vulgare]